MSRFRSPVVAAIASAALTATVVGGVAIAQTTTSVVITACVAERGGNVRLVSTANDCKANETSTFWNQKGEKGDQGLPGLKGDQGAQGNEGDKGYKGDPGTNGINGLSGRTEVNKNVSVPSKAFSAHRVECPGGTKLVSGGYLGFNGLQVIGSAPETFSWFVYFLNETDTTRDATLYAVCAIAS